MNKTFICLANSYKLGNRCIAGIEIVYNRYTKLYDIVRSADGLPKWFRPVNRVTKGGAIPNSQAHSIKILDIIEATEIVACPASAQQENHYYRSLNVIGHARINSLDDMSDIVHTTIFGNKGAAVHPDNIDSVGYSITLIKTSDVKFYLKDRTDLGKEPQPKAKIKFHGSTLDIPVTDPDFRHLINNDLDKANSFSVYYLAMSLGIENEGWFSKLVAGVIPVNVESGCNVADTRTLPRMQYQATGSMQKTLDLYNQGYNARQIAADRGLAESTIFVHLTSLVEYGYIDVHQLVPNNVIDRVSHYKRCHPNATTLREYFDGLNEEVSYNEIRLVLAHLNRG